MKKLVMIALCLWAVSCSGVRHEVVDPEVQIDSVPALGFWEEDFYKDTVKVKNGETFSSSMTRLGVSAADAYNMASACGDVFDVRKFRAGVEMVVYYPDSLKSHPSYVAYHNSRTRYTVFQYADSLNLWTYDKPVTVEHRYADISIQNSLWVDMVEAGASPLLISDLSDVYAWTVDFFGLQKDDRFRVFYSQSVCEGEVVGIESIDFAMFNRGDYELSAIWFDQGDGGNKYWNEKGESMRKAFLKAPLQFSRISSKFSYHRKHPVYGTVRAHTGVDYAAPAGTPVRAIGDGTVLSAGWVANGSGNMIKIRHNSVYTTAYLHLKGFAKGIRAGAKVHQGDIIGYVGSTGASTGPHLDFRVWKNGTPIDPLKMESPSAEPAKEENLHAIDSLYHFYRSQIK